MARPSLFRNRKFVRLSRLLGAQYRAVGVLEMMWAHAYEDGDPCLGTAEDVEFAVGWDGDPGVCASALVSAGFLDREADGSLHVHDLHEHCPDYVRDRMRKKAKRAAEVSGKSGDEPALFPADPVEPAEEEEAEPDPEEVAKAPALTSWTFPTEGKVKAWTLPLVRYEELREAFPALDLEAELRKALLWLNTNPEKKKTARGMGRFLYNWLSNAQNRPRLAATPAPSAPRRLERDDVQRARALVGSHGPEAPSSKPDPFADGSPEWVRLTARAAYNTNYRPLIPDPLEAALSAWLAGRPASPPAGWRDALAAAWKDAGADPSRYLIPPSSGLEAAPAA